MRYSHIIVIGLVSLGCTITAIPFNGKPQIARRARPTVTATFDGCTAVCWDATTAIECNEVQCDQFQMPGPTPKPVLKDRAAITPASQEHVVTTLMPFDDLVLAIRFGDDCDELCGPEKDNQVICSLDCSGLTDLPGSLFRSLLCQH